MLSLSTGQSHRQKKQQSGQMDQGGDTHQEEQHKSMNRDEGSYQLSTSTTTCSPWNWTANGD